MRKTVIIFTVVSVIGLSLSFYSIHIKYERYKEVSQKVNTRELGLIDPTFDYVASDNPLFYSTEELTTYLVEEYETEVEQKDKDGTLALIKEICPYVKVDGSDIHVPTEVNQTTLPTVQPASSARDQKYLAMVEDLMTEAEKCLGTPYVWGGTTIYKGMDCSGFVQHIYKQIGFTLPRVSRDQSKVGRLVKRNALKPGDLLFFDTTNYRDSSDIKTPDSEYEYAQQIASGYVPNVISHVGLYVGNGMMIHAASGDGYVKYESLEQNYYKNRFINARRLIKDE